MLGWERFIRPGVPVEASNVDVWDGVTLLRLWVVKKIFGLALRGLVVGRERDPVKLHEVA